MFRRRARAARAATLASSVEIAVPGALDLGCHTAPEVYDVPPLFRRWANEIERTRGISRLTRLWPREAAGSGQRQKRHRDFEGCN